MMSWVEREGRKIGNWLLLVLVRAILIVCGGDENEERVINIIKKNKQDVGNEFERF